MKYKTLFRVLLKLLGVYLFATGAGSLPGAVLQLGVSLLQRQWSASWMMMLYAPAYSVAYLAIGAYFFFGGRWIVNLAVPGNRPYCHECGYDLSHLTGNICPECGTPFRAQTATA